MTYQELITVIRNKLSDARAIEALIATPKFERLFNDSKDWAQDEIALFVASCDRDRVARWLKENDSLELGEHSHAWLRDKAKNMNIRFYSRLTKPELIYAIRVEEKRYAKK